MYTQII